jgi:WD40 repeat protein
MKKRKFGSWSDCLDTNGIQAIAISPTGQRIAIGSSDPFVLLVSAGSFQVVKKLGIGTNNSDGVLGVAFSPNGLLLAACAQADQGDFSTPHGEVCVWSVKTGARICHFFTTAPDPKNVAFSHDSTRLVVGGKNPTVWDVTHNKRLKVLISTAESPAAISPDGRFVAMAEDFGIYDIKNQTLQHTSLGAMDNLMFTSNGRYLVGGVSQNRWGVYDGRTGRPLANIDIPDFVGTISPDNQYLAASSDNIGLDIIKLEIAKWTSPTQ